MNDKRFTTEEMLADLPVRAVKIGNALHHVKYDEKNKRIYLLDSKGRYTGKNAHWDGIAENKNGTVQAEPMDVHTAEQTQETEPAEPELPEETAAKEGQKPNVRPELEELQEEEERTDEDTPPIKKPKFLALCAAAVAAITLLLAVVGIGGRDAEAPELTDATTALTDLETKPTDTTAPPQIQERIEVLVVKDDILPGEAITRDMLYTRSVLQTEYDLLLAPVGICAASDMDAAEKLVAIRFLQKGQYLDCRDIGNAYFTWNPWDVTEDSQISLPVKINGEALLSCLWGSRVDIQIEIQTTQSNAQEPGEGEYF